MVRTHGPHRKPAPRATLTATLVLAGLSAFLVAAPPAWATTASSNGVVAFVEKTNGSGDIWVANPDASGLRRLTLGAADDEFPTISPNGSQIAFSSNRATGTGVYDIWIMNTDGSNPQQLTDDSTFDTTPAWSPNGQEIAFEQGFGSAANVWVVTTDGLSRRKLNKKAGFDGEPAWSPDGASIAFASSRSGNNDIWTMSSTDGSGLVQLTHKGGVDAYPNWGPGGNRIAFESDRSGNYDVWTMKKNGDAPTQITHKSGFDGFPSYSPDGKQIAFDSDRSGGKHNIWYVRSSGVGTTNRVTTTATLDTSPAWQPLKPNQTVDVTDSSLPDPPELPMGTVLGWNFDAANTSDHDATDLSGMALFGSGPMPANGKSAFGFFAAGTYTVTDTTTGHPATVNVDPTALPPNGTTSEVFDVTWAVVPAPAGFVYDVQKIDCNGFITDWMMGQTGTGTTFMPPYEGSWGFQARLHDTVSGNTSAYSPRAVINVTGPGCPP